MVQSYNPYAAPRQPRFSPVLTGPLVRVTPPSGRVVSRAQAKLQCRIDADLPDDDSLVDDLIDEATDFAEREILGHRQILTATYDLPVARWWSGYSGGWPYTGYGGGCDGHTLYLPRPPLVSVSSVSYYDTAETSQTLSSSIYSVRTPWRQPGEIDLASGQVWPALSATKKYPATIRFIAGHATPVASVSTSADTLTVAGRTFANGDTVQLSLSGEALPGGLTAGTTYYVVSASGGGLTFKLSATLAGSAIDITDAGVGVFFIGEVPLTFRRAVLLIVGDWYANRENRGRKPIVQHAVCSKLSPGGVMPEQTLERWNIAAGELDRRITIEGKTVALKPDSRGHAVREWNPDASITSVAAKVETLSGRKLEIARQLVPTATHLITIRYRRLSEKDNRINYQGRLFNIGWLNNVEEKAVRLELTCTEERP